MRDFIRQAIQKLLGSKKVTKPQHISYSAIILDDKSHNLLVTTFKDKIPSEWDIIAHHMTIRLGELPEEQKSEINKVKSITATHIAYSDMVIAVMVDGYASNNDVPHVTLAVNPDGGKPMMSKYLTDWEPIAPLRLSGVIKEVPLEV